MKNFTEEDLIAYHLGELPWLQRRRLRSALENDAELAAESEAIAETLRAFSGEAAPAVDAAMLERSWQRVRPSLEVLSPAPHRARTLWMVGAGSALAGAAAVVLLVLTFVHRVPTSQEAANGVRPETVAERANDLLQELQGKKAPQRTINGPAIEAVSYPDAVAEDPSLALHLDSAERVLTEVSHSDGRLQPETREQVHRLLLENAMYYQSAETRGDMSTAAVIDDLGRVLTSLDAEPQTSAHDEDSFRLEMHLGDVLLDLRILHHDTDNKAEKAKPVVQPTVMHPQEKTF
jgi:hypothetical protein